MKNIMCFILASFILLSCKKELTNNETTVDTVTYEVTLVNASTWHGAYLNENAQIIDVENAPNNWRYTFKNTNQLFYLVIDAYADGPLYGSEDAILKIYVNGILKASSQSSYSPRADYQFP